MASSTSLISCNDITMVSAEHLKDGTTLLYNIIDENYIGHLTLMQNQTCDSKAARHLSRDWQSPPAVRLLAILISLVLLIAACGRKSTPPSPEEGESAHDTVMSSDSAAPQEVLQSDDQMQGLIGDYENSRGKERKELGAKIIRQLQEAEILGEEMVIDSHIHPDSMDMLVWYSVGAYYWEIQSYDAGLGYALRALELSKKGHNIGFTADCAANLSLLYFRKADYTAALEHARIALEYDRIVGDKQRISSSLSTLAAISLTAKQAMEASRYILEAIENSTAARDSARMAIQYGMASEIYLTLGENEKSLKYAHEAYALDSILGNERKLGVRLSQMASVQVALEDWEGAEASLNKAMPILQKDNNAHSLAVCWSQMGEIMNQRHERLKAAEYLEKAAEVFAKEGNLYNESRARKGLYDALKPISPAASIHLERYAELKDSIYKREMQQSVSQYNAKYKNDKYVNEIEHSRIERTIILIISIAVVIILGLVISFLFFSIRAYRRNNLMQKHLSRMRETFFTNITHELRTPLTIILGLSRDLKEDGSIPVAARRKMEVMERQGNGLLELINQLLDISKIQSAVGNPDWRNGNISTYLMMIIDAYRDFARSRNIDLHFYSKEAVTMDFVPDYVNKIMNNMLSNAFKFTPEYGKVNVAMWGEKENLVIEVSDTGMGMDENTLARIFEPFYQAEGESQNIGVGVGLTLVKQIVDAIDGNIVVESVIGKGSTFRIYMPIRNEGKRQIDAATAINIPALPENRTILVEDENESAGCRILVVEDNTDMAAYIGLQLSDLYPISYATNGQEGLEKAVELVPDLIITDLMMPYMGGLELCRQVRSNDIVNHIPIIVLTAKITEEERIKGFEAGADAYLSKPFNSDELRMRVAKLLEGRRMLREKFAQAISDAGESEVEKVSSLHRDADMRFLAKVSDMVCFLIDRQKDVDVSLVASKMCMSNSQFYRKLTALTGYTPIAYIQRIKIKKVQSLLDENKEIPFGEVAELCGFKDYSNFVRAFKNVYGITPTEYKRRASPLQ